MGSSSSSSSRSDRRHTTMGARKKRSVRTHTANRAVADYDDDDPLIDPSHIERRKHPALAANSIFSSSGSCSSSSNKSLPMLTSFKLNLNTKVRGWGARACAEISSSGRQLQIVKRSDSSTTKCSLVRRGTNCCCC